MTTNIKNWNWQKIIRHLVVWAVILLICNAFTWSWSGFSSETDTIFWSSIYGTLTNAFIFYANVYWLHSKYKNKNAYPLYVVLLLVIVNIVEGNIDYLYAAYENLEHIKAFQDELAKEDAPEGWYAMMYAVGGFLNPLFFNVFALIMSFAYIRWEKSIAQKKQLEELQQEKVKAELQYLKAQINPHFLFNGINSVYHLIDRNSELAKSTLMQFSSLLRYQLYECNEEKIPLEKEVAYVEDYLAMEKIRRGEEVQMEIDIEIGSDALQIAPLLLTPFLENAFKYLSNYSDASKNKVIVQLFTKEQQLHFQMENTYEKENEESMNRKVGGIGIENVRKRLVLLYPNQHELSTTKGKETFLISLKIDLA